MSGFHGKTYWLIGASEGLGREIAKGLVEGGAHVVLSARSPERLQELSDSIGASTVLPMDVTDSQSVAVAARNIGPIDGMIYNAGTYDPMSTKAWDSPAALAMLDVNLTGVLRVLGHVVPEFVDKNQGDITLIGSLAGYRGLPSAIGYGASKAALISLAETMRHDLKDTGVNVRIINPGFIKTRLTEKNSFAMPQLMTPAIAAKAVLRAIESTHFRTDFPWPFSWAIKVFGMLPDWLVYRGK